MLAYEVSACTDDPSITEEVPKIKYNQNIKIMQGTVDMGNQEET